MLIHLLTVQELMHGQVSALHSLFGMLLPLGLHDHRRHQQASRCCAGQLRAGGLPVAAVLELEAAPSSMAAAVAAQSHPPVLGHTAAESRFPSLVYRFETSKTNWEFKLTAHGDGRNCESTRLQQGKCG